MIGYLTPPPIQSLSKSGSTISLIGQGLPTSSIIDSDTTYDNKANKFYDYKVITTIPDNSNLNNYLTVGSYSVTSDASAKTMQNLPIEGNSGTLYVINCLGSADSMTKTGYEYFLQIFLGYTAFMYIRTIHCNDGTMSYGSWKQII